MTAQEIIDSVRYNLDDAKSKLFTDAQAVQLYKSAVGHIYRKMINANMEINLSSATATWAADTREVLFASSMDVTGVTTIQAQRIVYAMDDSGDRIPVLSLTAAMDNSQRSVYVRRDVSDLDNSRTFLGWYLIPSAAFSLTIYYIPKVVFLGIPNAADDASVIEISELSTNYIPSEHHDVLVNYMTVLALGKDEINAKFWSGVYAESLKDMVENSIHRGQHEGVVDVYESDYGTGYGSGY